LKTNKKKTSERERGQVQGKEEKQRQIDGKEKETFSSFNPSLFLFVKRGK